MSKYIAILCTCPTHEVAEQLATALVTAKQAACVNIFSGIKSIYTWRDKLESSTEHLLVIKTTANLFTTVETLIKSQHPYECPEIIALPITQGNQAYLNWITNVTTHC